MDTDMDTEQSRRMLNAVFKAKDVCAKVSSWMLHLYDVEDDAELCCYLPELKFETEKYYSSADFDITQNTTKHRIVCRGRHTVTIGVLTTGPRLQNACNDTFLQPNYYTYSNSDLGVLDVTGT
jgi:hypothetical protein